MTNVQRETAGDQRSYARISEIVSSAVRSASSWFPAMNAPRSQQGGAHQNATSFDQVNRRIIPIAIMALLGATGIYRMLELPAEFAAVEKAERSAVAVTGIAARAALTQQIAALDAKDRASVETTLTSLFALGTFSSDRFLLVADEDGRVFAGSGDNSVLYIGSTLSSLLPEVAIKKRFWDAAPVIETSIQNNDHYASLLALAGGKGMVISASSLEPLQQSWRRQVARDVTIFTVVSAALLSLLFLYYTQLRRAREAETCSTEANMRVETALSRGRCGLWDFDLSTRQMVWSNSLYDILGLEPRQGPLSFSEAARLLRSDEGDLYELARSVGSGNQRQIDQVFRLRHTKGHYVWLRTRAQVQRSANGLRLVGIAMDVSDQHRLAERYAEADQRLAEAIESTSEAFVLWDKDNRLVMCNAHYQQTYGLPESVLVPGTDRAVVNAAATRPIVETRVADGDRTGHSRTREVQLADDRWLQINDRRTGDGGLVSVGTDITQLKRHQERLRDSERRLMALISDLSASRHALEQKTSALSQANKNYESEKLRAEAANRSKSEFLANMSHELRTPLNAIIGFSEILTNEMFGPVGSAKYSEYARDIHDSGLHLLHVINDILDMSKIEAGHMRLNSEKIDLQPMIEEVLRITSTQANDKNIDIRKRICNDLALVCDRRALKQIMINLLSNAVKFTPEGGRIELRTHVHEGALIISVADTGIGIPPEAMRKIGQPFEQVQSQYARSQGGSGLGLAISRSLVHLHGGTMKIRSCPGKGTVVSVILPRHEAYCAEQPLRKSA
jgi:two-component system cell cycle sensor histidine kinase PleC